MDLPLSNRHSLIDQNFGLCISPQDLILPYYNYHNINYYRPWRWLMPKHKDCGTTIQNEKDKFKICLDVQHFKADEINVNVAGNEVIIKGNHEEREDRHGFISRMFKRRYLLPNDCNTDSVVSSLSSDGVLIVTANKKKDEKSKEIVVPIKICKPINAETDVACKTEGTAETTRKLVEEIKITEKEANNSTTEVMLREDHCRLLKPRFLGEAAAVTGKQPIGVKTEVDELLSKNTENDKTTKTSDEIEQKTVKSENMNIKSESEILQAKESVAGASTATSDVYSAQNIVKETIEVHQSSSSYSSSISSNIKEMNEKICEIVSDISAQLEEAAENI